MALGPTQLNGQTAVRRDQITPQPVLISGSWRIRRFLSLPLTSAESRDLVQSSHSCLADALRPQIAAGVLHDNRSLSQRHEHQESVRWLKPTLRALSIEDVSILRWLCTQQYRERLAESDLLQRRGLSRASGKLLGALV